MPRAVTCFSIAVLSVCSCRSVHSQCIATPDIQTSIDAYAAAAAGPAPEVDRKAAQKKVLDKAIADHPTDPFLLDRKRDWFDNNTSAGREAAIAFFAALREKYPDLPAVTAEYADVLRTKDSAQAIKLLEVSEKAHPGDSWTHYKLLPFYADGKSRNPQRLSEEIDAYLKLCPAPDSPYVYRIITSRGTHEQIVRHAGLLRSRLEAASGKPNQGLWTALWNLEFKAASPAGHPAVRERIRQDLARFETLPDPGQETWLTFLLQGHKLLGDNTATDRLEARIVERFPDSSEAERIVTQNWQIAHPFPRDGNHASQQAWYRLSASAEHAWYEQFHDPIRLWQLFNATAALDESKPDEVLAVARKYVTAYHQNPNRFYIGSPIEFEVADALIKKKALAVEIPVWIDEGFRRENNRPSRLLGRPRDELTDDMKADADRQIASMRIERARILLDYYDAIGQPAKAAGIGDQLAGVTPTDDRLKPELYEVRAHAASMQNQKLDALMYLRAARDLGGKQSYRGVTDAVELDNKIDLLYRELGGTHASLALFTSKTGLSPVSSMSWQAPKNPLPSFSLTDLGGKTWSLAGLKNMAVLVNVWATWCGPCREEHPALEKLYQKLKDRKDIAVLSVSVDEQAGLVAPYMAEHKYTFPVVLGKDLVDAVMGIGGAGIPQNWLISPTGKLETIQLGYGAEPDWQNLISSKLQEMTMKPK